MKGMKPLIKSGIIPMLAVPAPRISIIVGILSVIIGLLSLSLFIGLRFGLFLPTSVSLELVAAISVVAAATAVCGVVVGMFAAFYAFSVGTGKKDLLKAELASIYVMKLFIREKTLESAGRKLNKKLKEFFSEGSEGVRSGSAEKGSINIGTIFQVIFSLLDSGQHLKEIKEAYDKFESEFEKSIQDKKPIVGFATILLSHFGSLSVFTVKEKRYIRKVLSDVITGCDTKPYLDLPYKTPGGDPVDKRVTQLSIFHAFLTAAFMTRFQVQRVREGRFHHSNIRLVLSAIGIVCILCFMTAAYTLSAITDSVVLSGALIAVATVSLIPVLVGAYSIFILILNKQELRAVDPLFNFLDRIARCESKMKVKDIYKYAQEHGLPIGGNIKFDEEVKGDMEKARQKLQNILAEVGANKSTESNEKSDKKTGALAGAKGKILSLISRFRRQGGDKTGESKKSQKQSSTSKTREQDLEYTSGTLLSASQDLLKASHALAEGKRGDDSTLDGIKEESLKCNTSGTLLSASQDLFKASSALAEGKRGDNSTLDRTKEESKSVAEYAGNGEDSARTQTGELQKSSSASRRGLKGFLSKASFLSRSNKTQKGDRSSNMKTETSLPAKGESVSSGLGRKAESSEDLRSGAGTAREKSLSQMQRGASSVQVGASQFLDVATKLQEDQKGKSKSLLGSVLNQTGAVIQDNHGAEVGKASEQSVAQPGKVAKKKGIGLFQRVKKKLSSKESNDTEGKGQQAPGLFVNPYEVKEVTREGVGKEKQ